MTVTSITLVYLTFTFPAQNALCKSQLFNYDSNILEKGTTEKVQGNRDIGETFMDVICLHGPDSLHTHIVLTQAFFFLTLIILASCVLF